MRRAWCAAPSPKGRNVNKAQLIDAVAEKLEVSRRAAGEAVDAVLDGITGAVVTGDKVSLTGFGTFESAKRPARIASRGPDDNIRVVEVIPCAFGIAGKPTARRFGPGVTQPGEVIVRIEHDRRYALTRALLDETAENQFLALSQHGLIVGRPWAVPGGMDAAGLRAWAPRSVEPELGLTVLDDLLAGLLGR